MRFEYTKLDRSILRSRDLIYADLSEGFVHYEFAGMNDGPVVILIHGLSVSSFIWKYTYEYLRDWGFRVLKYDLYGRGFSFRLEKEYNMEIYERQLSELLRYLEIDNESLNLVGQSMGGTIATSYCLEHELDANKLVLIDTAGLPDKTKPYKTILNIPFLGKRIFRSIGMKRIMDDVTVSLYNPEKHPEYAGLFQEQAQYEGYSHAIVSSLMNMPMQSMESSFERIGTTSIPTLIIWGENDITIDPSHAEILKSLIPQSELHYIRESGHHPHYEQADLVNPILKKFLES